MEAPVPGNEGFPWTVSWGSLWQKLSEEYASQYEADAFGGEGEADHARTLRTRLLVGAGGAHDTWMNTSDLDVRTMVKVSAMLTVPLPVVPPSSPLGRE
jgi:hypothetical protein